MQRIERSSGAKDLWAGEKLWEHRLLCTCIAVLSCQHHSVVCIQALCELAMNARDSNFEPDVLNKGIHQRCFMEVLQQASCSQ